MSLKKSRPPTPRSFAPPSALPGISPTWGEIGSSYALALLRASDLAPLLPSPISIRLASSNRSPAPHE
ncbi:MAG: hypothetical protein EOQ47_30595 [Mesorhizobium sp.]|nr:MAG: hypothetical protein EOQ47_30595 [Mesorhizobium sp.]